MEVSSVKALARKIALEAGLLSYSTGSCFLAGLFSDSDSDIIGKLHNHSNRTLCENIY